MQTDSVTRIHSSIMSVFTKQHPDCISNIPPWRECKYSNVSFYRFCMKIVKYFVCSHNIIVIMHILWKKYVYIIANVVWRYWKISFFPCDIFARMTPLKFHTVDIYIVCLSKALSPILPSFIAKTCPYNIQRAFSEEKTMKITLENFRFFLRVDLLIHTDKVM